MIEDMVRTHKAALECRIKAQIPSTHPVLKWLVEYVSVIINRYTLQDDGVSAYEAIHGKPASERLAEFGERIMF